MRSGRRLLASPAHARAFALAFTSVVLCGLARPASASTECRDVRTGAAYTIPSARYSAVGVALEDSSALGRLCVGALRAAQAAPISDGAGGAFVTWLASSGEDCDLFIQHVGGDGQPSAGWPEGGRALCAAGGTQTQPSLSLADDGGVWAVWKDYREPQRSGVYLGKLTSSGERSPGFPENGLLVSSPDSSASDPRIVSDGSGGIWLVSCEGTPGMRRLLLKHLGSDGSLVAGWNPAGRPIGLPSADATRPVMGSDGAGGFALAWISNESMSASLRCTRIDASGSPLGGSVSEGSSLLSSASFALPTDIRGDATGAYLAWTENYDDSVAAKLARVGMDSRPVAGWPSGGRRLGTAGVAMSPAISPDGEGGLYVAWVGRDEATSALGVLLSRISATADSVGGWPLAGLRIAGASIDARRPQLLTLDGSVLATWSESGGGGDGTVLSAALASFGSLPTFDRAEAWPDLVRLAWRMEGVATYGTSVERRGEDGLWVPLGELPAAADGSMVLEDREVTAGEALTYRLRLHSEQMELVTSELTVEVPAALPLAINGLAVNAGRLFMVGSIPAKGESRFELFDVQGRRLLRDLRQHEHAGRVHLDWPVPAGVRAGVFFARFSLGRETKTRRFVVGR